MQQGEFNSALRVLVASVVTMCEPIPEDHLRQLAQSIFRETRESGPPLPEVLESEPEGEAKKLLIKKEKERIRGSVRRSRSWQAGNSPRT